MTGNVVVAAAFFCFTATPCSAPNLFFADSVTAATVAAGAAAASTVAGSCLD